MIESNPCEFFKDFQGDYWMVVKMDGQQINVNLRQFLDDSEFLTGIRHVQQGIPHPETPEFEDSAAYTWGRQIANIYECSDESLLEDVKNAFQKGELRVG